MWGQEANPAANKSEYIREGYVLRLRSKDSSTRNRKSKVFNVTKFIKRIRGAWKMCNLSCLFKLWIWCTTKIKKVKLIIKRSYCPNPLNSSFHSTTLGLFGRQWRSKGTFSVILVKETTPPLPPQTKLNFEQICGNDCFFGPQHCFVGGGGSGGTTRWAQSWSKNLSFGAESYVTITWKGFFTQSQVLLSSIVWNWFRAKKEIFVIFYNRNIEKSLHYNC